MNVVLEFLGFGHSPNNLDPSALVTQEKPSTIFLMETKNQRHVLDPLKCRLQYLNMFIRDPVGLAGGLAVLWNDLVSLLLT